MIKSKEQQTGFTLIELLVAMALLLIMVVPLLSFLRSAQNVRATSSKLSDVSQNARAAMILIERDIEDVGYNFPPTTNLGASGIFQPLEGTGVTNLYPIIPGNSLNSVNTYASSGAATTNNTDQITLVFTNQLFNNGLPVIGTIPAAGTPFTSSSAISGIYPGDFCILSTNGQNAIGVVTAFAGGNTITFANGGMNDPFGLNQASPTGPLSLLNPSGSASPVTLYKFYMVTYFVDQNGNLIRREQYPPPHTNQGGSSTTMAVAPISTFSGVSSNHNAYTCAGTCFIDNVIATGVEDLQFKYYLDDPYNTGITGPLDGAGNKLDPSYYGKSTNGGSAPNYRLLDIRRVGVSIKIRAQDRDPKLHDPYNAKQGYLYRFTLEGTFNTRNFYGSDYRPF
jgi:prepilin-type N-terminal cleavage/methylation domain-containing protein